MLAGGCVVTLPEPIYFDNAATSFPKPPEVVSAVSRTLRDIGGNPGRGGHRMAMEANRVVFEAREAVAGLFGVEDSSRIIFTSNATEAINLALKGLLRHGDHVITTNLEHNAVVRPLKALEAGGVTTTRVPAGPDGKVDPARIEAAIRPETRLIVTLHASNVTGTLLPIENIAAVANRRGLVYLVDAAQTAGVLPIDVGRSGIHLLACPGHKGLFGPQGTGFLCIAPGIDLEPLKYGGTGGNSELETQPDVLPERYESGTLNTPGLAGLDAGARFVQAVGLQKIREHDKVLTARLVEGLLALGAAVYGPHDPEERTAVVSFNIRGFDPAGIGERLDEDFGILGRAGLHCAPLAHKAIGTFPDGAMRLSPGYFNTVGEVDYVLDSLRIIANEGG